MALSCQTYLAFIEIPIKWNIHNYKCFNSTDYLPFSQVFEVYDSLPEPSLKTMDRVVLSVGIAGYLAFADTNFTGSLFHYF